ncbi:MAG: MauE/DoxX family redox-associated membrane protein [Chitinophagaceae bacterium]
MDKMNRKEKIVLYLMAVFYFLAGINHFVNPFFYKKIMPGWLPSHALLIYTSGAAEIILGLLLLPLSTRKWAAWGIILLLVAVFPANIQMMLNYHDQHHPYYWATVLRLALQPLLIYLAWRYTRDKKVL